MKKKLEIGRSELVKDRMRALSDTIVRPYLVGSHPNLHNVTTDDPAYRINPDGTVVLEMVIRDPIIQADVKAEQVRDKIEARWTKVRKEMLDLIIDHGMRLQVQKYRQSMFPADLYPEASAEGWAELKWNIRLLTFLYGVFNENPTVSPQPALNAFQRDCIAGVATQEIKDLLRATTHAPFSACCTELVHVRCRMEAVFDRDEALLDWLFVPPNAGYPNAPSGRILQHNIDRGEFEGLCRKAFTRIPNHRELAYPTHVQTPEDALMREEYVARWCDLVERKCTNVIFAHLVNLNTAHIKGLIVKCVSTRMAVESLAKAERYVAKQKETRKLKYAEKIPSA